MYIGTTVIVVIIIVLTMFLFGAVDHRDSRYMHGVCAHGLGRLRTAVSSYDTMLELLPGHFVFYLRQMALYMWRQMDAPLDCFNLDNDMHPCEFMTRHYSPFIIFNLAMVCRIAVN